jgi:hypothetical protein
MVPLSAASRENGAAEPRLKDGGSTRAKDPPPVRRRERMPIRLEPRVGERPAGAERGDDLAMVVLILAAGAPEVLAERKDDRGRWEGRTGLRMSRGDCTVVKDGTDAALVRVKGDGLAKSLMGKKVVSTPPFDRLENRVGSTFSKSSPSTASEALRLPEALEGRAVRCVS